MALAGGKTTIAFRIVVSIGLDNIFASRGVGAFALVGVIVSALAIAAFLRFKPHDLPLLAASTLTLDFDLIPKSRGWIVGTDAFFFREGTGKAYSNAKFGEFRVTAVGMAILVGLADADLKPLK